MWGTRGSQATPGNETVRYGGNTSCVEVRGDARHRASCSTPAPGSAGSAVALGPEIVRVDVLLTHLHMDHIQGLGFFDVLHRPGFEVHIWGPGSATADLRTRLTRYMSPPLFPVRLTDLPCDLHLHDIHQGAFEVPGVDVRAALVCHPGPTVGYRLEDGQGSLAYLPDHEPALASHRFAHDPEWCSGLELAAGVDVLIHDAQYTDRRSTRPASAGATARSSRHSRSPSSRASAASSPSTTTPSTTTTCSTPSSATHR